MKMQQTLIQFVLASCLLLNASCSPDENKELKETVLEQKVSARVIYGKDGRVDAVFELDPNLREIAQSSAALVEKSQLRPNGRGAFTLSTNSYAEEYSLCSSEPFYSQRIAAFCSGFLVDDDIMITAGHCIKSRAACETTKFLFGFAIDQKGQLPTTYTEDNVYSCAEILHTRAEADGADLAVIRLDRKVLNRKPLTIRTQGQISVGAPLAVVGHPSGLPTKIATGAQVRSIEAGFFRANLDTYGGNSGSLVVNTQSYQIEGILVRGEADYVRNGNCLVSNVCADQGCRGEDVTKITEILPYIK